MAIKTNRPLLRHPATPPTLERDFLKDWLRLELRSERKDEIGDFRRRRSRTEDEPTVFVQSVEPVGNISRAVFASVWGTPRARG